MKLLVRLLGCLHAPLMPHTAAGACARPALEAPADATGAEADPPGGCGWFDSSHELQRGLEVQEHLNADSLAQQLPLDAWLELHLSGWQPPQLQ